MKPTCPGRGCVGVYGFVLLFKAPFFFWKGSNWSPWAEICNIFDTGTERNETERDLENIWFDSFRFVPFLASYVYVAFRSVLFQSVRFRFCIIPSVFCWVAFDFISFCFVPSQFRSVSNHIFSFSFFLSNTKCVLFVFLAFPVHIFSLASVSYKYHLSFSFCSVFCCSFSFRSVLK